MWQVELEVPAQAEFVSLVRLVVSSVASDNYELSRDQVDNLKLAISEACVPIIHHGPADVFNSIAVVCQGKLDRFDVTVEGTADDRQSEGGIPLINSLVDEVYVTHGESGALRLQITLRCVTAERM